MELLENFKIRICMAKANVSGESSTGARSEGTFDENFMKETFHLPKFFFFFDLVEDVHGFYGKLVVTPKKIMQLVKAEPADDTEGECLKFLKRYIRALDDGQLRKFQRL